MQVLTTAPWGAVMQTRGHHTHQWSPDIQNTKDVIHRQIQSQMQKLTIECRKPSKGQTNIPGSNIHTLTHPFVFNFPRSLSWLFHHRFLASAHSFGKRRKCQVFTHGDYCWCGIAIQGGSRIEKIFRRVYTVSSKWEYCIHNIPLKPIRLLLNLEHPLSFYISISAPQKQYFLTVAKLL